MARNIFFFYLFLVIIEKFSAMPTTNTAIQTRNVPSSASISFKSINIYILPNFSVELKILQKPHHLFIGRCKPQDPVIHQENIILYNDGKSHVSATIRVSSLCY